MVSGGVGGVFWEVVDVEVLGVVDISNNGVDDIFDEFGDLVYGEGNEGD